MSTVVVYNGVTLSNVLTRRFEQTPHDDESKTDRIGYKYVIAVESIANVTAAAQAFGICGVLVPGTTAADLIAGVRDLLMEKRQDFSYSMDGTELVYADDENDLDNGPNPQSFRLTHITATTVKIEYSISFVIDDCHDGVAAPVVNNRWSCVDNIDERWRTTRTWRGKLRLGTNSEGTISPHNFRILTIPTLQPGWIRQRMNFVASTNGLELGYEIVDRQLLGDAAPYPCSSWSFTHTENMAFANGNKCTGSLDIRLNGTPRANKDDMVRFGILLLKLKLVDIDTTKGQSVLQGMTVTELGGNDECTIMVRGHVLRTPLPNSGVNDEDSIGNMCLRNVGKPISDFDIANYNRDLTINYGPFGTNDPALLAGLFACFLQTPCGSPDDYQMPLGGPQPSQPSSSDSSSTSPKFEFTGETNSSSSPTEISAAVGDPGDISIESPDESPEQTTAMYLHAKGDSTLRQDGGYLALPVAKANDSTSDDTTAFIQLSPSCTRTLRFEFERIEEWPIMIKPMSFTDSNGIKYQVKWWLPKFQAPVQTGDGHTLYVVDVTLELLMSRPPADGESIPTCELPWDEFHPADTAYPAEKFIDPDDDDNGIQ